MKKEREGGSGVLEKILDEMREMGEIHQNRGVMAILGHTINKMESY